jgi:hypothetical protein
MENEYWEYMMVVCGVKGSVIGSGGENITDILNRLGKDSWEAYATAVVKDEHGATRIQHLLKRRLDRTSLLNLE